MHPFAPILFCLIFLLILFVVTAVLRIFLGASKQADKHAYESVPLLTQAERSFFGVLQQAIASNYLIFTKVRLADIIRPLRNSNQSKWQSAFNRIASKHVDFMLCEPASLRTVGVIELDDSTHATSKRSSRDDLMDSALTEAGIPVLRVPVRQSYSPIQLREQIDGLFIRRPS